MQAHRVQNFVSCFCLASFLLLSVSPAEAQVRPRIVIAFDTSGSMATDFGGLPTFGDGSGGARNGIDPNCDGLPNDSRLFIAKQAMRNMLLSFGDVDWALSRFQQTEGLGTACRDIAAYECNSGGPFVTSYGFANAHARLGEHTEDIARLATACERRTVTVKGIKVNKVYDNLRTEPRDTALIERIGLKD